MIGGLRNHFQGAVNNYTYQEGENKVIVMDETKHVHGGLRAGYSGSRGALGDEGGVVVHGGHNVINENCLIKLTIISCTLNSDGPWYDKNDLYVQFRYDGKFMRTKTIGNAGRMAVFNE